MPVLGDIYEIRKVAEYPNDRDRPVHRQSPEQSVERMSGLAVGIALEGDAQAPDFLDEFEGLHAYLLPDGFSKKPSKKTDVLAKLAVLAVYAIGRIRFNKCHRCHRLEM